MSDDDSHVISDGAFPNGLYSTAIDDFSPDTEIAKLQKENGRIKVMALYFDSPGQRTQYNKKNNNNAAIKKRELEVLEIFAYEI